MCISASLSNVLALRLLFFGCNLIFLCPGFFSSVYAFLFQVLYNIRYIFSFFCPSFAFGSDVYLGGLA